MREGRVNLAIDWFAGYGLHEIVSALPDRFPLIASPRRWSADRFCRILHNPCAPAWRRGSRLTGWLMWMPLL